MQAKTPVEINPEAKLDQDDDSVLPNTEAERKPFVEPQISLPKDILEATAFFQGSAALDVADS